MHIIINLRAKPICNDHNEMDVDHEDEIDPCPGFDYDSECRNDPNALAEYANQIFIYYKSREVIFFKYLDSHFSF